MGAEESKSYHPNHEGKHNSDYRHQKRNHQTNLRSNLHQPDYRPPAPIPETTYKEVLRNDYNDPRGKDSSGRRDRKNRKDEQNGPPRPIRRTNSDTSVYVKRKSRNRERHRRRSPRNNEESPASRKTEHRKSRSPRRRRSRERSKEVDEEPGKEGGAKKSKKKRNKGDKTSGKKRKSKNRSKSKENDDPNEIPVSSPTADRPMLHLPDNAAPIDATLAKAMGSKESKQGKRSRKKKNKGLDKNNSAYHSAPDLTKIDDPVMSGGTGHTYYWPADQNQHYPFPFPPFLPPGAHFPDEMGVVEEGGQIVDGMGYPLGPIYPHSPGPQMSPNGTLRRGPPEFQSGSVPQYGAHPYYTLPYPYAYYYHPQYFMDPNFQDGAATLDRNMKAKSRHHKSANPSKKSSKKDRHPNPSDAHTTPTDSTNHEPLYSVPSGGERQDFYRPNQAIEVDDVKLASVVSKHHRTPSPLLTPPSSNSGAQSLDASSLNDVETDDVSAMRAILGQKTVRTFQPVSKKEVFIDGASPVKAELESAASDKATSLPVSVRSVSSQGNSPKSPSTKPTGQSLGDKPPMMTLCEKESIVATSFIASGGKVFCLTRSKSDAVVVENKRKTSSASFAPSDVQVTKSQENAAPEQKPEGTWFGITGAPPKPRPPKVAPRPPGRPLSKNTPTTATNQRAAIANHSELKEGRLFSVQSTELSSLKNVPKASEVDSYAKAQISPRFSASKVPTNSTTASVKPFRTLNDYKKLQKQDAISSIHQSPPNYSGNHLINDDVILDDDTSSSSESSDDVIYRSNSSLTTRLVRIDSHDSLTMRRRIRSHRKNSRSEERRATIGSISKNDITRAASNRSPSPTAASNPFRGASDPQEIAPLLSRAKSEEMLKQDLHQEQEEMMIKWSPRQRKETLQERAARILGLSSDQLAAAKKNRAPKLAPTAPVPNDVTSESFAVSVTSSMMQKKQEKYQVRDVVVSQELSEDDASTLSMDSDVAPPNGQPNRSNGPLGGANYSVNVSDSLLGAEVPYTVKPYNTATEYKLPDDVLDVDLTSDDDDITTSGDDVNEGRARIVASYSNNIYANAPHSRQFSDETTTESESVSARYPVAQDRLADVQRSMQGQHQPRAQPRRVVESPVPIASHSAPLTSEELDIVKQLYSSADETYDSDAARRRKVASAIGLDPRLIGGGGKSQNGPRLERMEDLDIKRFPTASPRRSERSGDESGHSPDNKGGVFEAMQSVGLDPEQAWVVSL